jgi:hypothetical protein
MHPSLPWWILHVATVILRQTWDRAGNLVDILSSSHTLCPCLPVSLVPLAFRLFMVFRLTPPFSSLYWTANLGTS